jgi:hypothetical protein
MDYEMQRHNPHPHVGPRLGGGCPALAGWRGEHYRNSWQEHRGWSQQYFPPLSSDAFLHPHHHPHPPSFLQHWPQGGGGGGGGGTTTTSNTNHSTSHLGLPASRSADLNYEGSFNHQIPDFSPLPPISAHQPYSPVTFVPPVSQPPHRTAQVPQGPGDFQHILHSNQPSPNPPTVEPTESEAARSESQPASTESQPPPSAPLPGPSNAGSGHDGDGSRSARQLHNPQSRASGHGFPPGQPDANMQAHTRLPPPASNPVRSLPHDALSRRPSGAAYISREGFASPSSVFVGLRSRSGGIPSEGNSDAPASPGSSLDDDSDQDNAGPRLHYAGLRSVRQAQLLRGQMSNRRVASQKAIKALQSVEIESLPEKERSEKILLPVSPLLILFSVLPADMLKPA